MQLLHSAVFQRALQPARAVAALRAVLQQHHAAAELKHAAHLPHRHVRLVVAAYPKRVHHSVELLALVRHLARGAQPEVHFIFKELSLFLEGVTGADLAKEQCPRAVHHVRRRAAVLLPELQCVHLIVSLLEHLLAIFKLVQLVNSPHVVQNLPIPPHNIATRATRDL